MQREWKDVPRVDGNAESDALGWQLDVEAQDVSFDVVFSNDKFTFGDVLTARSRLKTGKATGTD
eukprot:12119370-Karenia_brevis.AAC.1